MHGLKTATLQSQVATTGILKLHLSFSGRCARRGARGGMGRLLQAVLQG
jgi:hypothetical protein